MCTVVQTKCEEQCKQSASRSDTCILGVGQEGGGGGGGGGRRERRGEGGGEGFVCCCFFTPPYCSVGFLSTIVWRHAVFGVSYACVLVFFIICTCLAQFDHASHGKAL